MLARARILLLALLACALVTAAPMAAVAEAGGSTPKAKSAKRKAKAKKACARTAKDARKRKAKRCKPKATKRTPARPVKPAPERATPAPPAAAPAPTPAPVPAKPSTPPSVVAPATPLLPTTPAPKPAPQPVPQPDPAPQPDPVLRDARPFARTSFWNTRLREDAPLDPLSDAYVTDLRTQMQSALPWVNTSKYSSPVYEVPEDQPTVRVRLEQHNPLLQRAWENVPIPPDAQPAAGSDRTMIIWQPSTDTMWEFWLANKDATGWRARWGGRMTNVSKSTGRYEDPRNWGATATSLPMLGGLIRLDEVRAGRIDHALALAIPEVRSAWYSWPAQRTDGTVDRATAPPEGARFRIDPDVDLDKLKMPAFTRMLAEAAQDYGIVLRDKAGSVAFYGEDPTPTGSTAFADAFGGQYPSKLLASFPWEHLEVLRTDLSREPS